MKAGNRIILYGTLLGLAAFVFDAVLAHAVKVKEMEMNKE